MLNIAYRFFVLCFLTFFAFVAWGDETDAERRADATKLVERATDALSVFEADSHEWDAVISKHFKNAKGVFIVPALYKGGFFLGGEYGGGVLLARTEDGSWSYPAFYDMYSASLGFQFGGQRSRHLLLIMTDKALEALQRSNFDFGGDVNVAAGTAGGSLERSTSTDLGIDIFSFSLGAGAYAGVSFEGGKINYLQEMSDSYYDSTGTTSQDITAGRFSNPQADRLRSRVADYASE